VSAAYSADILIVGAGPAGLSTALHLAQRPPELAARILVLEKAHHPRPKLCAGALVVDAEVILGRLWLDCAEVPHVDASVARFNFRGRGPSVRLRRGHTLRSPLGEALMARWLITWILYGLRWRWLQFLIWRLLQPVMALLTVTLVINWARRSR